MGAYFESGLRLGCLLSRANDRWLDDLGVRSKPLLLSRGRDCLYVIIKILGLQPGAELLLPAFICHELIEAVQSWGLAVRLYDINRDLTVSPAQVAARVTSATKAVLYVNYFGLPQPPEVVRELRQIALPLIEDSCQSPFALREPGAEPDFAFTSLRKYLPVPDGAVLDVLADQWQARAQAMPRRSVVNRSLVFWRTLACGVRYLQERHDRRMLSLLAQELFSLAERALRDGAVPAGMSSFSRRIAARCDIAGVRQRRRENYEALVRALDGADGVELITPRLPEDACPYGCVLSLTSNRLWRDALHERNIQAAILWDCDDHREDFPASRWLSQHLLVLPVAQTNTTDDMARVAAVLREYHGD